MRQLVDQLVLHAIARDLAPGIRLFVSHALTTVACLTLTYRQGFPATAKIAETNGLHFMRVVIATGICQSKSTNMLDLWETIKKVEQVLMRLG